MGRFCHYVVLGLLVAACGEAEPKVIQGSAVDHGKALFSDPTITGTSANTFSCATCHATARPETSGNGPLLTGAPLAGVTRRPSYWGGTEVELLRSINACLYYFMLSSAPFSADDERTEALYAYLDTLPSDTTDEEAFPFTVVTQIGPVPAGDAARGKPIYERACQTCHGAAKTGAGRITTRAPILPDQTLAEHPLGTYTEEQRRLVFVEKTRHGGFLGYGGEMPPFSKELLSDQEIGDMLVFLGVP